MGCIMTDEKKSSQKTSVLGSALIARKGEAKPTPAISAEHSAVVPAPAAEIATTETKTYYKSMTFKVDRVRYERLKQAGLQLNKRSQDILTEALDQYLQSLNLPS